MIGSWLYPCPRCHLMPPMEPIGDGNDGPGQSGTCYCVQTPAEAARLREQAEIRHRDAAERAAIRARVIKFGKRWQVAA